MRYPWRATGRTQPFGRLDAKVQAPWGITVTIA
jgi:hypothetical protein